jgi:hypothetical protein
MVQGRADDAAYLEAQRQRSEEAARGAGLALTGAQTGARAAQPAGGPLG